MKKILVFSFLLLTTSGYCDDSWINKSWIFETSLNYGTNICYKEVMPDNYRQWPEIDVNTINIQSSEVSFCFCLKKNIVKELYFSFGLNLYFYPEIDDFNIVENINGSMYAPGWSETASRPVRDISDPRGWIYMYSPEHPEFFSSASLERPWITPQIGFSYFLFNDDIVEIKNNYVFNYYEFVYEDDWVYDVYVWSGCSSLSDYYSLDHSVISKTEKSTKMYKYVNPSFGINYFPFGKIDRAGISLEYFFYTKNISIGFSYPVKF